MMRLSSKGIAGLLAIGVVVLGFALWVTSREPSAGHSKAGQLVLPKLEGSLNAITEVRLKQGHGTATTLEKHAHDWLVAQRGYPADSGLVRKLLLELARMKIVEQKTSNPAQYSVIGVEPITAAHSRGTRIDLVEPGKTVSLIVGNPSGEDLSFVRLTHARQSLLVTPQIMPDANPKHWLNNTVVNVPQSRIEEVRVEPAKGPAYTVVRGSPKQLDFTVAHLPRGRHLSSTTAANSVASALTSLTLEDVRKLKGTQRYSDRAIYRTFHGLTIEVKGLKDGKSRYITVSARAPDKATQALAAQAKRINTRLASWQLEILGYQYDSLFEPLDSLLKPLHARHPAKRLHRAPVRR